MRNQRRQSTERQSSRRHFSKAGADGWPFGRDFKEDKSTGCWLPQAGMTEFSYSDGKEVEARIRRILLSCDELGSGSLRLRREISDWPSLYHLSPARSNLLRPFGEALKGNVLEIGAGCGALTRFLGECGGAVTAVEGSVNRASAAAARCRNLPNVRVIVEAFDRLRPSPIFNAITLIGVLEYARAYFPTKGADPVNAMLMHAAKFLVPNGLMFVAIENQLGLKYFAGSGEDHVGIPFFGLEDRYPPIGSCVTFGRRELQKRLSEAGIPRQSWWFPFPDYKFPSAVVSEDLLLTCSENGLRGMIESAAARDPQSPANPSFSLKRAWGPVLRNGMGGDLANSFLVIAGAGQVPAPRGLGFHFSSDRKPEFSKRVVFAKDRKGRFHARSEKIFLNVDPPANCPLQMSLENRPVLIGDHWMDQLQRILGEPGWSVNTLVVWARPWLDTLIRESGIEIEKKSSSEIKMPGGFLDAVPRNLVFTSDKKGHFFDLEWKFEGSLELGFLLFRGIFLSLLASGSVESPAPGTTLRAVDIFFDIARSLGFSVGDQDVRRYCELEQLIQRWATDTEGPQFENVYSFQLPLLKRMGEVLAEQRVELTRLRTSLTESTSQPMDRLSNTLLERDAQIHALNASLSEANGRMGALSTELTARLEEAARLSSVLTSRDEQIHKLNGALVESNGRIEALSRTLESQTHEAKAAADRLGTSIEEKDSQIHSLNTSISEANGRMGALSMELTARLEEAARLSSVLTSRDEQIHKLNGALVESNGRIEALSRSLVIQTEKVNEVEDRLGKLNAEKDSQNHNLKAMLVESNGRIEALSRSLVIQTEKANEVEDRLVKLNAEKDSQNHNLKAMLEESNGRIDGLSRLVEEQAKEVRRLFDSGTAAAGEIERMRVSLEGEKSEINRLQDEVELKRGQIARLNIALDGSTGKLVRMGQELEQSSKRGEAVAAELDSYKRKSDLLELDLMRMSDWASRMDKNPLVYGLKKGGYKLGRAMLRSLPIDQSLRQSVRRSILSVSLPFRKNARRAGTELESSHLFKPSSVVPIEKSMGQDILVFSIIDWHFRFQRPQHLAKSFAKTGRRVFFFSNHFIDSVEAGYTMESLNKHGDLFQIKLHVKGAPPIYFSEPSAEVVVALRASMARVIADQGIMSCLAMIQHPYWFPLVKDIPNTFRIYDCMDHHEGFGNVPAGLVKIEKEMMCHSDLVVVTSSWLEEFAKRFTPNVALVRNAGEFKHFADPPSDVFKDSKGRKIIGYYGAIADWFDVDLVRDVAERCPGCLVMLVGDDTRGAGKVLKEMPNVVLTGEVPYSKLPFYLHSFDVCMLPFRDIPLTQATNPVKVYEYLAAGKPVVSIDLPELTQFGHLIERAKTKGQFVTSVKKLVQSGGGNSKDIEKRKRFASQQTWDHRIDEFISAWNRKTWPKISVVVLTYNQWELSEACLKSLLEETDYPNFEIIIVDNASTDGTPAHLQLFSQGRSNVKIILNEKNHGFAGGNNAGLAAATGDYLVILNNDTVVTRGWATTLWRHLADNPKIGLIGPATNNIGNEARIDTTYSSVADMPQEARRYTISNMGKVFSIRTAAFFCVMMPRAVYEKVGPLCEEFGRGFFEDDDYCRRVEKAGYAIVCADDVFVHHHLSASFNKLGSDKKKALFDKNKVIYEKKWGPWVPHAYRK